MAACPSAVRVGFGETRPSGLSVFLLATQINVLGSTGVAWGLILRLRRVMAFFHAGVVCGRLTLRSSTSSSLAV